MNIVHEIKMLLENAVKSALNRTDAQPTPKLDEVPPDPVAAYRYGWDACRDFIGKELFDLIRR